MDRIHSECRSWFSVLTALLTQYRIPTKLLMISFEPYKPPSEVDIIPVLQMRKLRPRAKRPDKLGVCVYPGEIKSVTQIYRLRISPIQSVMQQILSEEV